MISRRIVLLAHISHRHRCFLLHAWRVSRAARRAAPAPTTPARRLRAGCAASSESERSLDSTGTGKYEPTRPPDATPNPSAAREDGRRDQAGAPEEMGLLPVQLLRERRSSFVAANVRENVRRLSIDYPVALDSRLGTWTAWHNQYWPGEIPDRPPRPRPLLPLRRGRVRSGPRQCDPAARRGREAPPPHGRRPDRTPTGTPTPESYLGYERLARYGGKDTIVPESGHPLLPSGRAGHRRDTLAYGGALARRVGADRRRGGDARLGLRFRGRFRPPRSRRPRHRARSSSTASRAAPVHVDGGPPYTLARLSPRPAAPARAPVHARSRGLRLHLRLTTARAARRRPARDRAGAGSA